MLKSDRLLQKLKNYDATSFDYNVNMAKYFFALAEESYAEQNVLTNKTIYYLGKADTFLYVAETQIFTGEDTTRDMFSICSNVRKRWNKTPVYIAYKNVK